MPFKKQNAQICGVYSGIKTDHELDDLQKGGDVG